MTISTSKCNCTPETQRIT